MLMILSISTFYFQIHVDAFKTNYIELVDSIENPKYTDINVVTSDNIKERIRSDNRKFKETSEKSKINENEEEKIENILLVGIDSRTNNFKYARADTIIIVSINKLKRQINLTSIMRDTYVKIPRYRNNRINAAYAYGGAELLKKTINNNFNLDIEKHIVINFKGFEKVIDILGGLDVDLKKYEVNELNRCIAGLGGRRTNFIKQSGIRHFNGQQALAYCRIRRVGKGDSERTERQRKVIKLIIEKIQGSSFSEYPKLVTNMYPYVKTNIGSRDYLKLICEYYNVKDWNMESIQIPTDKSGKPRIINSMWVIDPDLEECKKCIKEFIY